MSDKSTGCFLLMIGFGVYGFFSGFSKLRKKRMVENVPTSKIRGMAMGTVEIIGKVEAFRSVLTAPFTEKKCVYFKYEVEEYRSSGKNSRWVTIAKGDSARFPFFINDGTGRVLVSPQKAEMILPSDFSTQKWKGTAIERFCLNNGIRTSLLLGFSKRLRFTEWHIQLDEEVYVLGYADKEQNFLSFYDQELMVQIEKVKADAEKMKQFDLNHDGEISGTEWQFVQRKIEQDFIQEHLKNAGADEHFDVVIQYNPNAKMFLISDKSQKELLQTLGFQVFYLIWGGAALALLGLFLLLLEFNLL